MPQLDISDHAFVARDPATVRAARRGPCHLDAWIPGLGLEVVMDRGDEGILWRAGAVDPRRRPWRGTAEVWLEPWHDGTVVHLYVRLDPADPDPVAGPVGGPARGPADEPSRWREALRTRWRTRFLEWRRSVDGDRAPGTPAPSSAAGDTPTHLA